MKSMIIQLTSSWMSSLPVKKWEEIMKMTVDFKVDLYIDTNLVYDCIVIVHNIAVLGPKLLLCKDIDRF